MAGPSDLSKRVCIKEENLHTLRFRIIGGAGIVGGLETLVDINNRGAGIVGGLETLVCTNNRGVECG